MQYALVELRVRKGLTQEDLAKKLNISRQTLIVWEKDLRNVDFNKIYELANIFDVKINEIRMQPEKFDNQKSSIA